MHKLIGIIVYSESRTDALDEAKETLDNLCGDNGQPFDYGSTMDDSHARWQGHPWVCSQVILSRTDHGAPGCFGCFNSDTEKAEAGFHQNDHTYIHCR